MNRFTHLMKNGWFVLIGAILFSCATTKTGTTERHENIIPFKYKQLEGIILAKDYQMLFPGGHTENRFTPTFDEIVLGEKFLKSNIKEINTPLMMNQGDGCPIIHKNLKYYFRQYSGHFNENGDRVLSINFLWDRYTIWDKIKGIYDHRPKYKGGYYFVLDGGSYYWQISINLTTMKVERFSVNGAG